MSLLHHFSNARKAQEMLPGTVFFAEGDPVGPMYFLGHQVIEIASPASCRVVAIGDLLVKEKPEFAG